MTATLLDRPTARNLFAASADILTLNESHDVAIAELLQFGASDEAIDRVERDFQLRRDQIRHDALRGVLGR